MAEAGPKRVLIDNHLGPYSAHTLSQVNPDAQMAALRDCDTDAVLLQAKCHWGHTYYDTSVGTRHPALDSDLIAAQLEAARKHDIDPALYYSVRWDEHAYRGHPEWRSHDAKGRPLPGPHTRWRWVCLNSPYRDYTYAMLDELLSQYEFSRLFLDIVHYRILCHCEHCQQAWQDQFGESIPSELVTPSHSRPHGRRRRAGRRPHGRLDPELRKRLSDFGNHIVNSYLLGAKERIAASGKGVQLTHNAYWPYTHDDYLFAESDATGANFFQPALQTHRLRALAKGRPVEIAFCWDNVMYGGVSESQLTAQAASALAAGADATMIWGAPNTRTGSFGAPVLDKVGATFKKIGPFAAERAQATAYAEVGLLFSEEQVARGSVPTVAGFSRDTAGAYKYLSEQHYPFRLLCDDVLEAEDFNDLRSIIVAHPGDLKPETLPLLREFVEQGGRMLVTGANNLQRELDIILAARQDHGNARQDGWYIHAPRDWNIPDWELACSLGHWPLRNFPGFGELAYSLKPVVQPHGEAWDSHGTRWGTETGMPAVVFGRMGDGQIAYCNHEPFAEYLVRGARAFGRMVERILTFIGYTADLRLQGVPNVEAAYTRDDGQISLFLVNCPVTRPLGEGRGYGPRAAAWVDVAEAVPLADVTIKSALPIQAASAASGNAVQVERRGEHTFVTLARLSEIEVVTLQIAE
jgi:hypothetical protein